MNKQNGVTLVALAITVIILGIVITIGLYTGIGAYRTAVLQKFKTEMQVVQERVNLICDDWKNWEFYNKEEARKFR